MSKLEPLLGYPLPSTLFAHRAPIAPHDILPPPKPEISVYADTTTAPCTTYTQVDLIAGTFRTDEVPLLACISLGNGVFYFPLIKW